MAFLSIMIALVSATTAVGLMNILVTRDFFLARFLPLAPKLPLVQVWAAAWVLAVMATVLGGSVLLLQVGFPWIATHVAAVQSGLSERAAPLDLISTWHQMTIVIKIVAVTLFIMSGWSIGVLLDRWIAYGTLRRESREFAPAVAVALRAGRIDEAIEVAERNKKSHLARVVTAGLMEFKAGQNSPHAIHGETVEASKRALERTEAIVHNELLRGLDTLATIGSTAPFVGLFGTVMGILQTFKYVSSSNVTGLAAVAGGISEALVTTAIGLLVAIPAIVIFNYLTGIVATFDTEMNQTSTELIEGFSARPGLKSRN